MQGRGVDGAPAFWFDENANAAPTAIVAVFVPWPGHFCVQDILQKPLEYSQELMPVATKPLEGDALVMVYACDHETPAGVMLARQAGKQP